MNMDDFLEYDATLEDRYDAYDSDLYGWGKVYPNYGPLDKILHRESMNDDNDDEDEDEQVNLPVEFECQNSFKPFSYRYGYKVDDTNEDANTKALLASHESLRSSIDALAEQIANLVDAAEKLQETKPMSGLRR